jgi:hypothetical protein
MIAGVNSLLVSYPQEIIKAKIQVETLVPPSKRKYRPKYFDGGITMCAKDIYRSGGLKGKEESPGETLFRVHGGI